MKAIFRGLSVSMLALAAAGCSTPNPTPLNRTGDMPKAFTAPVVDKQSPVWPDANWWVNFKADELPALMETAQKENLDIAQAAARVIQAEATDGAAFANLLPAVNLQGGVTRTGSHTTRPVFTTGPGGTVTETFGTPTKTFTDNFTAGLAASYQLDFWGLNQDRLRQARENLRSARYAETVIGLTTESSVAQEYFTILATRERITITRQNIDAAKRILAVVEAKVVAGVSSNLDLSQEQAQIAGQEATLPGLIEQEREARYALAILLGRAPEGFDVKGQNLDGIASPVLQGGLPSEVLLRRPDVAEAEANLYAAHANVDAARAAFFPSINLTGSGSYAAPAIGNLINPTNFAWSIGASLLQTIFDGGAKKAASDLALAQEQEQIAAYRKSVFNAFSNVETALGQVAADGDQLVAVTEEVRASTEAFRISELQYREGTIDILNLLQAQQTLFSAESTLVQTKLARLESDVSLYIALGGGWTQQDSDKNFKYQLDWWPI
ncbi:MAG TPA: efflux transporter outer membrane subunit [Rhizomicrobium sp.]|nr:efflux transporter outer membrane subunit [Rhizomicrobium sp.]